MPESNAGLTKGMVKSLHDFGKREKMEAYLRKIQTIRGQFPVQCNPNLLACAISDHLESAEGQEMMKRMLMQESSQQALKAKLLRQSMILLGFTVENHYGRDVFYTRHVA